MYKYLIFKVRWLSVIFYDRKLLECYVNKLYVNDENYMKLM